MVPVKIWQIASEILRSACTNFPCFLGIRVDQINKGGGKKKILKNALDVNVELYQLL